MPMAINLGAHRSDAPYQSRASIGNWRRFIAALQDCIMQIGWMRFARVEREDHALALGSTFTSCTPGIFFSTGRSLRTHSSQSSPSVAISMVSK
jgi:hypothetical protein